MDCFNQTSVFCYDHGPDSMADAEGFSGLLDIYVHHARNIHNICIYENQDVYAKFSLTYSPDEALSTRIVNGGGKNPEFNENLHMKVTQSDAVLKCEVWMLSRARNYLDDQLLGFALVPLSSLEGKGKLTQNFSLSSTDLFHSPAGTVKLTLFLDTSAAFTSFTVSTNSSISSEVVLLDPKGSEPLDSVDQFKRIEFPDINILTENHKMVSEYFDMAERNSATRTGLVGPASFLHLDASSQSLEDYEMAVNSSEENCGGSFSPNGTVQNSGVFSSTTTSLSDDRNSGDSMEKNNRGTRDSSNSALEPHQSSDTSPETPTSKYGNLSRDNSKNSEFSSKGEKSAEQGSLGSVKLDPIFTAPLGNINIEDEQTTMQQQIVDMYMRSMQQFTESLAKMKLPMDLNKQESNDGGQVIEGRGNKLEAEKKKEGSRVFYGSRAFF